MALLHNIILRGLNSILLIAPHIPSPPTSTPSYSLPQDVTDFLAYCQCFSTVLRSHHAAEESVYFPLLESMISVPKFKGTADKNHDEHESFLKGLRDFDTCVNGILEDKEEWKGEKLVRKVEGFAGDLHRHLVHEVEVLASLEADPAIDWVALGRAMADVKEVPFLITNSDVTYEGGIHGARFPPFPWFVHEIFRWIYLPRLKGAWRFSSCDDYGMPRELPFVGVGISKFHFRTPSTLLARDFILFYFAVASSHVCSHS
ncbi:hypothetical protein B0J14DRAFT_555972 [Halenospora varia]|nr:hypothetical protein B0J14DRAFT_555972 [Halenospora varia]